MLQVQSVEDLEGVKLNVSKRKTKKTQIFLYDTQRRFDDFIMKLRYRNNEKYEEIPHFIISKSGDIFKVFDTDYSSKTFGVKNIDNRQVKIALENLGWLIKNTITGALYNWIGDPYRSEPYVKRWRNYYFWDPYSEEQMNALVKITKEICKLDLNKSCKYNWRVVRALSPKPAAFVYLINSQKNNLVLKIFDAEYKITNSMPGQFIILDKNTFAIGCSDGILIPKTLALEGRKTMSNSDCLRGLQEKEKLFFQ